MSDQDFFFDDEVVEEPKKEAAKKKAATNKPAKKASAPAKQAPQPVQVVSAEGMTFGVGVVALIAIVALLFGVIIGIFIGRSLVPDANFAGTGTQQTQTPGMGGMGSGNAPQLSDEQIQQGMPEGHPQVDDADADADADAGADADAEEQPAE